MSRGYSVAQTARLVCALRWACGRLAEMLDAWAAQAASDPEHAEAAAAVSELSRRLASQRATLDGLQPDSELMAPWRQAAPADPVLAEALDGIAALEGSLERLDIARNVLVPQLAHVYGEMLEHAAPHCDAALASAARALRQDLDREAASARVAPFGAAEAADRALTAAGGIVEPSLLRPEGWP
ncbi:MAG: hypothetical protein F4Z89_06415 [Acidimicrobiaceae bacterium]|nr:hypothetical protein [Acidimicrobiaceae bacterium]